MEQKTYSNCGGYKFPPTKNPLTTKSGANKPKTTRKTKKRSVKNGK